jgi:hypothetical protein
MPTLSTRSSLPVEFELAVTLPPKRTEFELENLIEFSVGRRFRRMRVTKRKGTELLVTVQIENLVGRETAAAFARAVCASLARDGFVAVPV